MKTKYVFTGTVKKCKDVYWYNEYGDQKYFPDFRVGNTEIGTVHTYAEVIAKDAIIVQVGRDQYIWLDMVDGLLEELRVDLGISNLVIYGEPFFNGALFVDQDTLIPYFEYPVPPTMGIKKLKKTIAKGK